MVIGRRGNVEVSRKESGMDVVVAATIGIVGWFVLRRVTSTFVRSTRRGLVWGLPVVGCLGAAFGGRFGIGPVGFAAILFVVGSIVLAEIDLRTRRLPREISYPLFGSMLTSIGIAAWDEGTSRRLVDALVGAAIVTFVLLVLHLASRGGLGDGDVRLAPALGTLACLDGVDTVWTGLLIAFVAAGSFVAVLMMLRRVSRSSTVPFGPFLIGGALAAALFTTS